MARMTRKMMEEICMAAVKQNGLALEYVKEQTPEIFMADELEKENKPKPKPKHGGPRM